MDRDVFGWNVFGKASGEEEEDFSSGLARWG
jgi:hypothetical protein